MGAPWSTTVRPQSRTVKGVTAPECSGSCILTRFPILSIPDTRESTLCSRLYHSNLFDPEWVRMVTVGKLCFCLVHLNFYMPSITLREGEQLTDILSG